MLTLLQVKNFYSFAEEIVIDFSVGQKPAVSGFDIQLPTKRLNKVIAVVGANGSGKTQFIKPLAFLSWFICESFLFSHPEDKVLYSPHRLYADQETELTLEFLLAGIEYRYQLTMLQQKVVKEALFVKNSNQFSYLFKREKNADTFTFRQQGFPFAKTQAQNLRDNTSILAAAYSYDIKEALPFIQFFRQIRSNVANTGRHHFQHGSVYYAAAQFEQSASLKTRMAELMAEFDLGLNNVTIKELKNPLADGKEETLYMPFGVHQLASGEFFVLPFTEESSGTQSAFVLLERILPVLQEGGIAVIDELDNDLHPHLIPVILDLFRFEHTNPYQAQLIFTCHSPEVLNRLQKHQVYLCAKQNQQSIAWRLDQMTGLRADDNLYAKYMAGALGAVPEV